MWSRQNLLHAPVLLFNLTHLYSSQSSLHSLSYQVFHQCVSCYLIYRVLVKVSPVSLDLHRTQPRSLTFFINNTFYHVISMCVAGVLWWMILPSVCHDLNTHTHICTWSGKCVLNTTFYSPIKRK